MPKRRGTSKNGRKTRARSRSRTPSPPSPLESTPSPIVGLDEVDDLAVAMEGLLKHRLASATGSRKKGRVSRVLRIHLANPSGLSAMAANAAQMAAAAPAAIPAMVAAMAAAAPDMVPALVEAVEAVAHPVRQEGESAVDFRRRRAAFHARSYEK